MTTFDGLPVGASKPLALMVLNFKLRHYATLSTKPIGSMGLDDLPT